MVENWTRFDFVEVVEVEVFEVIGMSKFSSWSSWCSSAAPPSRWMWVELNLVQAIWADVIVVISVVRSLIVESLLYILFQIIKTFQFFFIFTMKYEL